MKTHFRIVRNAQLLVYCFTLQPALIHSQETDDARRDTVYHLSPIVVTATQAFERSSPVTFSDLNGKEIQERYSVQDIPVLLSELPSVTSYSENGNGIGYNYINLRGFDQRRLSIMVNGIPQNDPEDHNVYWIDLPDLLASTGNIQVQRGAGSAFYGPPAIGGSVNIVTNPFDRKPGVTLESMLGLQEYGSNAGGAIFVLATRKYAAEVHSGMVNNQYMLYGRLAKIMSDGYREHSYVDFDSYFLGAIRFDKNMTTRVHFFGGPIEDGLAYYGLPKFVDEDRDLRRQNLVYWETDSTSRNYSYRVPRRLQEIEHFSQPHYELMHDWQLSPTTVLHNALFYYTGDGFFDYDASWADTSLLRIGYTYGIPASQNPTNTIVRAYVGNRQWGWLPRIELDHRSGTMTLGAEVRLHRSTHWGRIQFAEALPPNFDPDYHFYEYNGRKEIVSVYAHELYRPEEKMTLMLDMQLVRNRYTIENEKHLGNTFSQAYTFLNPRVGLNYNFDDELHAYVSLGYTSREPRLRNLYAAEDSWFGATPQFRADTSAGAVRYDFSDPLAKPESLLDVELGGGYRTSDFHLRANVFWMEFTDELVKSGQVDIFGQPVTGNAERTRHVGLEVDGAVSICGPLMVSGNFSLSQNRLVRYMVIDDIGVPVRLDDNPIAGFPDVLGNLRLTYRDEAFTGSVLGKYVGAFYTDNFNNENNKNDAYTVFNAEMLYTLPVFPNAEIVLRGEVRNIFNNLYFSSGEGNAFFPAAERNYIVGVTARL